MEQERIRKERLRREAMDRESREFLFEYDDEGIEGSQDGMEGGEGLRKESVRGKGNDSEEDGDEEEQYCNSEDGSCKNWIEEDDEDDVIEL